MIVQPRLRLYPSFMQPDSILNYGMQSNIISKQRYVALRVFHLTCVMYDLLRDEKYYETKFSVYTYYTIN